jgi:SARP family transcriptional regulator, regulator of embCAB operon
MSIRIYLAGGTCIEATSGSVSDERAFPGRQGRLAFAFLVLERQRAVRRDELIELLWPGQAPAAVDSALSAILSKLRNLLATAGLDRSSVLRPAFGCHQLQLPPSAWIDIEAAIEGLHDAETALRAGDPARAYGPCGVALHIAERPFLMGEESAWVERWRQRLHAVHVRALECDGEIYLWNGEPALAVELARRLVDLEPFRETAWQLLMRAHTAAGNPAEALQVYDVCRRLLNDELGVGPSPQTRSVHRDVLRAISE